MVKQKIRSNLMQNKHWDVKIEQDVGGIQFPHIVIDNFFTQSEFDQLEANTKNLSYETDEVEVLETKVLKNGSAYGAGLEQSFAQKLDQKYRSHLIQLLEILAPKKVKCFDHSDFHLVRTPANREFKIHDDTPDKLLSTVIYISPENNHGTFVHSTKDDQTGGIEVPWKKNRAFIFSRKEKTTWHSYKSNTTNDRVCLVYNLKSNKISNVYFSEGLWLKALDYKMRGK